MSAYSYSNNQNEDSIDGDPNAPYNGSVIHVGRSQTNEQTNSGTSSQYSPKSSPIGSQQPKIIHTHRVDPDEIISKEEQEAREQKEEHKRALKDANIAAMKMKKAFVCIITMNIENYE